MATQAVVRIGMTLSRPPSFKVATQVNWRQQPYCKMATTAPDLNETNLTYTSELATAAILQNGYRRARFE